MLHRLRTPFPRAGTPRGCRRPWFWLRVLTATVFLVMSGGWEAAASPAGECPSLKFSNPPEPSETNGSVADGDRVSYTMHEGESATYTVRLSRKPTAKVRVTLTVTQQPNTEVTVATDPSNATGNQNTLSFTRSNWDTAQTVTVSVAEDDDTVTDNATIEHEAFGARKCGVRGEVQVIVLDNDVPGLIFNPTTVTGPEGGSYTYTVRLAAQPTAPVTVTLTQPANADVTVDTDPNTGGSQTTLTFTPTGDNSWNTTQTVTVSVADDDDIANDAASVAHRVSGAAEYADLSGNVQVRVTDTDVPGPILSQTSVTVVEGGIAAYTMKLATQPTAPVKVTLTQPTNTDVTVDTDPGATGNQTTLTFTTENWSTAQTVTVEAAGDTDAASDMATVAHTASGAAEYGSLSETLQVKVDDDDSVKFVAILSGLGFLLLVIVVLCFVWAAKRGWLAVIASLVFVFLVVIAYVSKFFATGMVAIVIAASAVVSPIIVIAFRVNTRSTRAGEDSEEHSRGGSRE